MKTFVKRSLAILIAVLMVMSMMAVCVPTVSAATNFVKGDTIYFRANSQWKSDSPRFAAYFCNDSTSVWVNITDDDGDSYYEVTVPGNSYSKVIFCRMNGRTTANIWDNVMNQTPDLYFDGTNDCYELTGGLWDGSGSWSVYAEKLVYFVNTKGWDQVAAYCTNYSSAGDIWPGDLCKVIDADKGVYAVYPGNYPRIIFTDYTANGESTATFDYTAVRGKYIEPTTGYYYNTADEALAASVISLAGSFNEWSLSSNVFKLQSGNMYKTTVSMPAGTYTFKIVHNGLWYGNGKTVTDTANTMGLSYADSDCVFNASGGKYDFYFDVKEKTVSIEYVEKDTNTEANIPTVSLSGSFNDWTTEENMTISSDKTFFTKTMRLEKGDYYFNIVEGGLWYGTSATYTDSTSAVTLYVNGGACTLRATGGEYTFKYDYTTNKLTITSITDNEAADITTVSLAGDFNGWSTNANVMTKASVDTVTTTLELKSGMYLFKVVQDSLWYGNASIINDSTNSGVSMAMTSGNCTLQASGGTYTFTYNVVSRELSVSFVAAEGDPADTAQVALVGDFNSWNQQAHPLVKTAENTVSVTAMITSGVYNFKILDDGLWYGYSTAIKNKITNLRISYTGGNCTLTATGGEYTFTYNVVTKRLTITYVESTDVPAKDAVVYLSGDFNSWSTTDTKMNMVSDTAVETTVSLDAGTYNFKVVHGASWYGKGTTISDTTSKLVLSSIGSDCVLYAGGGEYTFTYDVVTHALTITAVLSEIDPAETAIVALSGDFNEWALTTKLTYSAKNTVAVTLPLENGTYKFKLVTNNLWYGNGGTIVDTTDTTSSDGWDMSPTDPECTIQATGGTYTFSYNVITNKLVVKSVVTDPAKNANVYLAGSFNDWSTSENKLTYLSTNTVSTTISLEKGTYYFKMVDNGLWYGYNEIVTDNVTSAELAITNGDCTLDANGGEYTFKYNVVTKKLTIISVISDPALSAVVSLAGDFNDWDSTATMFTYDSEDTVVATIELEAGTYCFKVVEDSLWYGNNGTMYDSTINTSNTGWIMSMYEGDCVLEATGGIYTFCYKVSTNSLIVSHTRTS